MRSSTCRQPSPGDCSTQSVVSVQASDGTHGASAVGTDPALPAVRNNKPPPRTAMAPVRASASATLIIPERRVRADAAAVMTIT